MRLPVKTSMIAMAMRGQDLLVLPYQVMVNGESKRRCMLTRVYLRVRTAWRTQFDVNASTSSANQATITCELITHAKARAEGQKLNQQKIQETTIFNRFTREDETMGLSEYKESLWYIDYQYHPAEWKRFIISPKQGMAREMFANLYTKGPQYHLKMLDQHYIKVTTKNQRATDDGLQMIFSGCWIDPQCRLGRVSSGDVWLGYRQVGPTRQEVAVKEIPRFDNTRFRRLLDVLLKLQSPNVVRLEDAKLVRKQNSKTAYIVMERCVSSLTKAYVMDITQEMQLSLLHDLFSGLAHLHNNNVIHRDIKPSNLLIDKHGCLKLADFDLTRPFGSNQTQLTSRGTVSYMAPELYGVKAVSFDTFMPADMFSAGCVAYYIVSRGSHAFSEDDHKLIMRVESQDRFMAASYYTVQHLIKCLLAHDPRQRPSASDCLKHPYIFLDLSTSLNRYQFRPRTSWKIRE